MSTSAALRASELHKLFQTFKTVGGSEAERNLLENARRVSAPLAMRMLSQMGLGEDTNKPFKVFENACGVGVVAPLLQKIIKPDVLQQSKIHCGDFSQQLIDTTRERIGKEGWVNTEATTVDAQKTGFPDGTFTHVATNIGFHVVPDSEAALNEAIRILQPGGILGFTTWHKEAGWVTETKEAFKSLPYDAPFEMSNQTTEWGHWSDINWIRKTLEEKGLEDVKVHVYAFLSRVDDPDFFIFNCGMMMDWIMKSCWPEELRNEHPREEVLANVKEFLGKKYGGGGWDVSWVAVVATARVPSV